MTSSKAGKQQILRFAQDDTLEEQMFRSLRNSSKRRAWGWALSAAIPRQRWQNSALLFQGFLDDK
jgi:hypothetical protein